MVFKKNNIPWNKGLTKEIDKRLIRSEETRGKISISETGKKLSEETKNKMRKPKSEEHRKNMSIGKRGIKLTEETIRKISKTLKGRIPSIQNRIATSKACKGRKHTKEAIEKIKKARLNQILPIKDTSIEVKIQNELNKRNIMYKKHIPVCGCQPDIVFPEKKIVIFCDGDYWHNLPERIKSDLKQNFVLKENGWKVLRFWEHDINNNLDICMNKILGGV